MKKHVVFKTQGVCARSLEFDLIDGYVYNVKFEGGCRGNTGGVGALAEGVKAEELVKKLKGIRCRGIIRALISWRLQSNKICKITEWRKLIGWTNLLKEKRRIEIS